MPETESYPMFPPFSQLDPILSMINMDKDEGSEAKKIRDEFHREIKELYNVDLVSEADIYKNFSIADEER